MQTCGVCRQALREDDHLITHQFASGAIAQACRDCLSEDRGTEPDWVPYPVGAWIPEVGEGLGRRKVRICGICRTALRWDEDNHCMRVSPEDIGEGELKPGCYMCCSGCVDFYKPKILGRLIRDGILKPEVTVRTMPRNALL